MKGIFLMTVPLKPEFPPLELNGGREKKYFFPLMARPLTPPPQLMALPLKKELAKCLRLSAIINILYRL